MWSVFFQVLGAAVAGGILGHLLSKLLPKKQAQQSQGQHGEQSQGGDGDGGQAQKEAEARRRREEEERRRREEEERRLYEAKERQVRKILDSDPRIAERFKRLAGKAHRDLQKMSDADLVRELARTIPDEVMQLFQIAQAQQEVKLNLQRKEERIPVEYPTSDIEPTNINSLDQLSGVIPEQMALDDDEFYLRLANNDLLVLESFETQLEKKRLYILLDVSGSMAEQMRNGLPKHIMARGIVFNLCLKAADGEAEIFLRPFDGAIHDLRKALNPEEAERMIDFILGTGFSGGGTYIFGGFSQAVSDIRQADSEVSQSEILLITDGEDSSMNNVQYIKEMMGKDIRLHSLLMGNDSPALREASTTYRIL